MVKCENETCNNEVVRESRKFCSIDCYKKGHKHSEEAKKKISIALKGKPGYARSAETRKKMSIAKKGKILSVERRKQISKSLKGARKGYSPSEETRRKISLAFKGKPGHKWSAETRRKLSERIVSVEVREKQKKTRFGNEYIKLCKQVDLSEVLEPLFILKEYKGIRDAYGLVYYSWLCLLCGKNFNDHIENDHPVCLKCFPYVKSHYEDEIVNWLEELFIQQIVKHDRKILNGYELDIYLPDYNLAIEFNGLYWHSEIGVNKDKNYHLDKTNQCEKQGIQLVHIFEDEWIGKQEIVKSIIKSKLGLITNRIYARECTIKLVHNTLAKAFLFDNHLQTIVNCKYYFGLYSQDLLVYLIGISKPRFNKDYQYELVRSCGKINVSVVGGFSKLIKHAVKALSISTMISYVDRRYFTGKGYKDWKLVNSTSPNYYYTKDYLSRESRVKYQKHKLQALFPNEYADTLTEWQIMQLSGFDRIYDCGNLVYELYK